MHYQVMLERHEPAGALWHGAERDLCGRGRGPACVAVAMKQQGSWTCWDIVQGRSLDWHDLGGHWIKSPLFSVCDVLPMQSNLHRWKLTESPCRTLCRKPASLKHIFSFCKASLADRKLKRCHDQVLAKLPEGLEQESKWKTTKLQAKSPRFINFLWPEEKAGKEAGGTGILAIVGDWEMQVDLKRQLKFPDESASTSLRPDIVICSKGTKQIAVIELTVLWEERTEKAHDGKLEKYRSLIFESKQRTSPQEVGGYRQQAGRDIIPVALAEEERAVAKPRYWERGKRKLLRGQLQDIGSAVKPSRSVMG